MKDLDDLHIMLDIAREDNLEDELGPFKVVQEVSAWENSETYPYLVIETEEGSRFVARPSDRHADAHLVLEPEDER